MKAGARIFRVAAMVLNSLARFGKPSAVFVNLGKDYLPAIEGIHSLFEKQRVTYAQGGIGSKMTQTKRWLHSLPSKTATLPGKRSPPSYLYFFPDWDDYVTEPFVHETAHGNHEMRTTKRYAHQVFGADDAPYDGMLVSLAQIYNGKGMLSRLNAETAEPGDLRKAMRIPKHLLLFGDCGAFSYVSKEKPPFSAEEAARLYHRFGFDVGASVDHIPGSDIVVENEKGELVKRVLTGEERKRRMRLTARNAEAFLATCRRRRYKFLPIGVIQGLDTNSYVRYVHKYIDMGYQHNCREHCVVRASSVVSTSMLRARSPRTTALSPASSSI